MNEQQQAQALAQWLERGGPPPEGLDPEVLATVYALRPDLAPEPTLGADDILGDIAEGPLARSDFDFEDAVDDAFLEAAGEIVDLGSRRRVKPFAWVGGLAAAAALLLALRAGTLAPEPPRTVDMVVPLEGAPQAAPRAQAPVLAEEEAEEAEEAMPTEEILEAADDAEAPSEPAPPPAREAKAEQASDKDAPNQAASAPGTVGGIVAAPSSGAFGAAGGASSAPTPATAPPAPPTAERDAAAGMADEPLAKGMVGGQEAEKEEDRELADEAVVADEVVASEGAVVERVQTEELTTRRRQASRKAAREAAPASEPAPAVTLESAEVAAATSMRAGSVHPTIDQALARSSDIAKAGNPAAAARYLAEFIVEPAADGQRAGLRAVRYAVEARQTALARRLADKAIALDPTSERADQIREALQGSP